MVYLGQMKYRFKTFSSCNISTKRVRNKGFGLLEVLVAAAVGVMMILMIASLLARASRLSRETQQYLTITSLGVAALDAARAGQAIAPASADYNVTLERQAINNTLTRITVHVAPRMQNAPTGFFTTMQARAIIYQRAEES